MIFFKFLKRDLIKGSLDRIAEFTYTTLLSPWPLRQMVNYLILLLLPQKVCIGDAVIYLNPRDPVISGALLLQLYENKERLFVLRNLNHGAVFLDIGANVGFYTAIAMHIVGDEGVVIAFEPDPESYSYLEKTIKANNFENALLFQMAASDKKSKQTLYSSLDNRGDNRLYNFENAINVQEIVTSDIDSLLYELNTEVSKKDIFVKIDIQGYEGLAISGMENTIRMAKKIILLMEFWPDGLKKMQTDPFELLSRLESYGLALHILNRESQIVALSDKSEFVNSYQGRKYTNIVGVKN